MFLRHYGQSSYMSELFFLFFLLSFCVCECIVDQLVSMEATFHPTPFSPQWSGDPSSTSVSDSQVVGGIPYAFVFIFYFISPSLAD